MQLNFLGQRQRQQCGRARGRRRFHVPRLVVLESRTLLSFIDVPPTYGVGASHPSSVAVGDFNGDGIADLAVTANPNGNVAGSVSVLLGNGDGSFKPAVTYTVGKAPQAVAVGDFNGDGIADLAVPNYTSNTVSVLLGNGDGTFQPARTFSAGSSPRGVAVGDFNGDGATDLAVTNAIGLSVLLGNGDGTFAPAVTYALGSDARSLVVGDFNGDGTPDVVVVNTGTFPMSFRDGHISVLLGNGDGTFQPAVTYATGTYSSAAAVGDFNGDGIPDLVVANTGGTDSPYPGSGMSLLRGNGDGSFRPAVHFADGSIPGSVAVGDFNGDGIQDLAVGDNEFDGSVLLGNGDGTFRPPVNYAIDFSTGAVAVGDWNGDGSLDFIVVNAVGVNVLTNNGDGTFRAAIDNFLGPDSLPRAVVAGDFNGDGIADLAVADAASNAVRVLLGNGDGTFRPAVNYAVGKSPNSVAVGDFNGDGVLDLVTANYDSGNTVSVLLGNGNGTFQPARSVFGGAYPTAVTVGDFNGDGSADLVVAGGVYPQEGVSVLLGNGNGTFRPAVHYDTARFPSSVAVADFNADGIPDLAVGTSSGVSVLLGNGDGSFGTAVTYAAGGNIASVAVGDFNGDGFPDLVAASFYSNTVGVLLGNGDGTFRPVRTYAATAPASVAVGDFNGDGIADLVVPGRVLQGNGDGTFTAALNFLAPGSSFAVADFNGDGLSDFAAAYGGGGVVILLNDGVWPMQPSGQAPPLGRVPTQVAIGTLIGTTAAGPVATGGTRFTSDAPLPAMTRNTLPWPADSDRGLTWPADGDAANSGGFGIGDWAPVEADSWLATFLSAGGPLFSPVGRPGAIR